MDRARVIAALVAVASLALAIAGLVIWREMSPSWATLAARCDGTLGCALFAPQHRLHPLRAELLWAAATVAGVVAVGLTLRACVGRDHPAAASS